MSWSLRRDEVDGVVISTISLAAVHREMGQELTEKLYEALGEGGIEAEGEGDFETAIMLNDQEFLRRHQTEEEAINFHDTMVAHLRNQIQ